MNKKINNTALFPDQKVACCDGVMFGINDDMWIAASEVVSQSIRVHLQNSRQGTVKVKSRSDLISRSNKKPWRQKGTGRARAGSARSPLWRGGGVCFGPQPRTRRLFINKKMNHCAFAYLFLDLLDAKKVFCADIDFSQYTTKYAIQFLKNNNLNQKKTVILYDNVDNYVYYSFANIDGVKLLSFDSIGSYDLANAKNIVFLKKNEDQFKKVVTQWFGQKV